MNLAEQLMKQLEAMEGELRTVSAQLTKAKIEADGLEVRRDNLTGLITGIRNTLVHIRRMEPTNSAFANGRVLQTTD